MSELYTVGYKNVPLAENWYKISQQEWDDFPPKLRTNGSIEWLTPKCDVLMSLLGLPDSVKTRGKVVNFVNSSLEYSFLFPVVQKA